MTELFHQYQNYIISVVAFALIALLAKLETVQTAINTLWSLVLRLVTFIGEAFTETNGKASFSRIAGFYVIIRITTVPGTIPEEWMSLFMFLIGYQLISGLLKDNPAIVELIKAKYSVPSAKQAESAQ